jgi:AraC-like DNA-binding protein
MEEEKKNQYLTSLFGLAESHLALNHLDSTNHYIIRGYKEATGEYLHHKVLFLMTEGRLAYLQGSFIKAKDNLSISLPILESNQDLSNLAINAYWLGKSENSLGNSLSAVRYYKMVDSIFDINKSVPLSLRPVWSGLIDYYNKKGDFENELKYARKLIVVDSVLDLEYYYMTDKITNEFVLPTLEQKNRQKQQELEKSKKIKTTWLVILAFLLCVLGTLFFLYRKRELKRIKDYNLVLKRLKKSSSIIKPSNKTLKLKKELVNSIEQNLKLFEQNEGYLKNSTTLSGIARNIGTNQRYLSQYINHSKGVGFPEYINTLRIEYVLKRLSQSYVNREDRFRIWSMSEVAKAAGFGSREYYAKAFFKYTNMKHRTYINQLEKNYSKRRNS